jgi:hypothetical protein
MIRKKVAIESLDQVISTSFTQSFLRITARLSVHQYGHFYIDGLRRNLFFVG